MTRSSGGAGRRWLSVIVAASVLLGVGATWSADPMPVLLGDSERFYVYDDSGLPLQHVDADGEVVFYQHDQYGSTTSLTGPGGETVATFAYDADGRTTAHTGVDTPLRWAGQYRDPVTGLYNLRARHYDPLTAQFITRDPLEALTGEPYAYAGNDPLNLSDLSGLCPMCIGAAIGAVAGGGIELGFQVLSNAVQGCRTFHDINWGTVAAGAAAGAAGGGLISGLSKTIQIGRQAQALTSAASAGDEVISGGRYLFNTWHRGTFPHRTQSVNYHLAKPGNGRSATRYTRDAMDFFAQNRSLGQSVMLRDGTAGIKISTKQQLPGGRRPESRRLLDRQRPSRHLLGLIMNRQALQDAASRLGELPFPPSPVDPDLADWVMDLLEADTYYAGLAHSALAGARFDRPPEGGLSELADWLEELRVPTPGDEAILDNCRTYFAALRALHEALRS